MITTRIGQAAEVAVADFLISNGYKIVERNFRNRVCEIDIIAQKQRVIYFVEVKYRSSDKQGDGLEYITPKKLRQMHFAAEIWVQQHNWTGDYQLLAASVNEYQKIKVIELDS